MRSAAIRAESVSKTVFENLASAMSTETGSAIKAGAGSSDPSADDPARLIVRLSTVRLFRSKCRSSGRRLASEKAMRRLVNVADGVR